MDKFARNALRLSLAGAGVAVLGAGFVGQASAAEAAPTDLGSGTAPDASKIGSTLTGAAPEAGDNDVSFAGQDLTGSAPSAATVPTATTPSSDSLPSLGDTQAFQVPSVANLQAPGLS